MIRPGLFGVLAVAMPGAAAKAQEVDISFGAAVVSEYVSNGIRYSDGVALQPYVELAYGGIYAGAYTTNVDPDLTGADRETGLSLGYRGEAGKLSYDLSVTYYLYAEAFDDFPVEDYAEAVVSGTFAATESFYVTADAGVSPEFDQTDLSLRIDYYTAVPGLSLDATIGRVDANYGSWSFWSAGAGYRVNDTIGLALAYHDSDVSPDVGLVNSDGLIVGTVSVDF
jgi:uncharacterized protein (TIGR02001 family)